MAEPIIINNFNKGIATSPYVNDGAVANSVNLDIFTYPGIARNNVKSVREGNSTGFTGYVKWIVRDDEDVNKMFCLTAGKEVYKSTDGGRNWFSLHTATSGAGDGLAIWEGYLFVLGQTTCDIMNISTEVWTDSWAGISSLTVTGLYYWKPMIVSKNNGHLYFGDGQQVSSLKKVGATFDPTNSGTYSYNSSAMQLPLGANVYVRCMDELKGKLYVGTIKKNDLTSVITDYNEADIYTWDMVSEQLESPIILNEFGVQAMKSFGTEIIIVAGTKGHLYSLSEGGLRFIGRPPVDLKRGVTLEVFPQAICSSMNKIFIGYRELPGLYSVVGGKFNLENTMSLSTGTITCLNPSGQDFISAGWISGSNSGIDFIDENNDYYTNNYAYFESLLYRIGTFYNKATISKFEIQLTKPMTTGDSIKIAYRTSTSSSYTDMKTIDYATYGAIQSFSWDSLLVNLENIQFKVYLNGSVELLEFRALP